jgi:hypothetical protein
VKRKPVRKPAKRKRSAGVQGIPVGGGWIQGTFFPLELRPAAEVRAEQDGGILHGRLDPVDEELLDLAKGILADVQRWKMEHSDKPHRYSWGPGFKHFYTAEESVLVDLVERVVQAGFAAAVNRYRSEVADLVARLERQTVLLEQRRENGKILHAEGQVVLSKKTAEHDQILCRLYRSVRGSFPTGGKGNTAALDVVRQRHQRKTNRDRPVTRKTVRNALKRRGVPCR